MNLYPETLQVAVILVNFHQSQRTLACLDSLQQLDTPGLRRVVVDNGSTEAEIAPLRDRTDIDQLICAGENLGFSGGCNLGIAWVLAQGVDAVWLLNNDSTVTNDSLWPLVERLQQAPGLVGSVLRYPDGRYQQVGTRFRWATGTTRGVPERDIQDGMPLDALCGASLLISADVLHAIGPLDERYFLYFEDAAYCLRARRAGFPVTVAAQSVVLHEEGGTTGRKSLSTQYYYHRNRLLCLAAFAPGLCQVTFRLYAVYRLLRTGLKTLLNPAKHPAAHARVEAWAVWDGLRGVTGPCRRSF